MFLVLLLFFLAPSINSNLNLYAPSSQIDTTCIGASFESKADLQEYIETCTPNVTNCQWNIMTVVLTNNQTVSTEFLKQINLITSDCSHSQTYFTNFVKINTINGSCPKNLDNVTKDYYLSLADMYPLKGSANFSADNAADILNNVTDCIDNHPAVNGIGGIAYVYIDIPCNDSCSSAKMLNYQAHFIDSAIRLKYTVWFFHAPGEDCYDKGLLAQCSNSAYCKVFEGMPTQDSHVLCPLIRVADDITALEMGLSLGISFFLLFVMVLINTILICQKQNRVQEAYNRLREKHFPNAGNDYMTSQEKKTDEWEIFPGDLEVFASDILGTGAFATVYKGKLTGRRPIDDIIKTVQLKSDLTDDVAIKRPPHHADTNSKHDFREEINFMKKLGYHTHILGMIGCVTILEPPMIVMQYCEQGDLLLFLHKNRDIFSAEEGPTRAKELLSISWQISDGLCYLKSLELIHRDLAARNILLTKDLTAKISDFGLCRQGKVTDANSIYISKGGRLPVKWMAPESLKDYVFSFSTDIWAYGIVLWETFSLGESPFPRINGGAMYDILEVGQRLENLPLIPDDMYQLMAKCWRWEPEERITIEVMREELMDILADSSAYYGYLSRAMMDAEQEIEAVDSQELMSKNNFFDDITITSF